MTLDSKRQHPQIYPAYFTPQIRLLNARLMEIAVQIKEDVESALDGFAKTLQFPEIVFQGLRSFRQTYDQMLQELINRAALNFTCRKGCPACCHVIPSGVEPLEVIEIYNRFIQGNDAGDILQNFRTAVSSFQRIQRQMDPGRYEADTERFERISSHYYALRIPCGFLDSQAGTCRIYEVRPLICRAVFSLTDPALCHPEHTDFALRRLEVIEPPDEINLVLLQIQAAICQALNLRFPDTLQHGILAWDKLTKASQGSGLNI